MSYNFYIPKAHLLGKTFHDCVIRIPQIQAWSAESPHLYAIAVELRNPDNAIVESFTQKVGFRDVKIVGHDLLVNGQPIILYGMNRHDFHPQTGRVLSREDMRNDLLELKKFNFNAIRTSHYPNDPVLLDLCDELGFYAVGEANIESHAFQDSICNDQRYLTAFEDTPRRPRDLAHVPIHFLMTRESRWGDGYRVGRKGTL